MKRNFAEYFYNYLKPELKKSKCLDFDGVKFILLKSINDYFNKKINTNFLSSVATEIYYEIFRPSDFFTNPLSHELGKMLDYLTDLSYQEEQSKKSSREKVYFSEMLETIKNYLHKYKHELKSS